MNISINGIAGLVRDYFFDDCRENMSFKQFLDNIVESYDSDTRCHSVQSELDIQTLEQFMTDPDIFDSSWILTKIVEHVYTLTPQCLSGFCSGNYKIVVLCHAALSQSCV